MKLIFEDIDGTQGYVEVVDGTLKGIYNGGRDSIHKLLRRADGYEVAADGTRGTAVNVENASAVFDNVVRTVDSTREATAEEKYAFVKREAELLPAVAFLIET